MHRLATTGVMIWGLVCASCAPPEESPARRDDAIYGGTADNADPSAVLVGGGGGWCTGTLISPKLVLTAGHCIGPSNSFVWFGSSYLGSFGTSVGIDSSYATPDYVMYGFRGHDIGIIVLHDYSELPPVPLNTTPLDVGLVNHPIRLIGFGEAVPPNTFMQKNEVSANVNLVSSNEVQITDGICHGDSGGPGLLRLDGGQETVGGVISWTGSSGCASVVGGLTRVDVYATWIQAQIATQDPPSCGRDGRCVAGCVTPDVDCSCLSADAGRGCNDLDPCTSGETCSATGACGGGVQKSCNAPPNDCHEVAGTCNFVGACSYAPKPDGVGCAAGPGGQCFNGACRFPGACGPANGVAVVTPPTGGFCDAGTFIRVNGTGPWTWSCFGGGGGASPSCAAPVLGGSVPGGCGSANGVAVAVAPASGLCSAGTPTSVAGAGPWTWTCAGANSSSNASCSAPVLTGAPDGGADAGGASDAGAPDAGGGPVDSGQPDAGAVDAGADFDAGAVDGGPGSSDGGPVDAGGVDAGVLDGGDAGGVDAGATDAGAGDSGVGTVIDGACGSANGVSTASAPAAGLCSAGTPSAVTGAGPFAWTCVGASGGATSSCSAPLTESETGDNGAKGGCGCNGTSGEVPVLALVALLMTRGRRGLRRVRQRPVQPAGV